MSKCDLHTEIKKQVARLNVLDTIRSFSLVTRQLPQQTKAVYVVMILDTFEKSIQTRLYTKTQYADAYDSYAREEQRSEGETTRQVVLVKMDSIKKLEKAYPNYFADLKLFTSSLETIVGNV